MTHPRDEWATYHPAGTSNPVRLLVHDGAELDIADAKAEFVAGTITVDELEQRVHAALDLTSSGIARIMRDKEAALPPTCAGRSR